MIGELKAGAVIAAIAGVVALIVYVQYAIIRDCGFIGLLHGAEWVWLFGGCN